MPELKKMKCCCSCPVDAPEAMSGKPVQHASWITGSVATAVGNVPVVAPHLVFADRRGAWKARWAIGRMDYRVEPGLYAIGTPTPESEVLVSANYKMSFDRLRSSLAGFDGWILVLDTKGINVWCAAGEGTFGTDELVRQIHATGLANVVTHRRVIVPQLGAPGIAAHEVRKRSGFQVMYGPVRAKDICSFVDSGMEATSEMRRVEFPLADRLAVIPVELVLAAKLVLAIMAGLLILSGLGPDGYATERVLRVGIGSAALFGGAFVAATVLTPPLLPWLPGRAFSLKGTWIGIAFLTILGSFLWVRGVEPVNWLSVVAWCLLIPVTTSFAAMNFTGATTYTSLSGVRREMRAAVPIQATAAVLGTVLWLVGRFF